MCGAGDDASYVRFGETKDKYFNRSLKHGIEMRHQNLRSDSVLVHTGYIGTGAILVPGFGTQPYWGEAESRAHPLVTGVPQESVFGSLLFSTYATSLGLIILAHGISYHCYADDTPLYFSFRPDDPTVAARISGCLADISAWMKEHHLQLNLAKTELLVFPATPNL